MSDQDVIERGRWAKRLLKDEEFQAVVREVQDEIIQDWRFSEDREERERLHAEHRGLERVLGRVNTIAGQGEFAEKRTATE